MTPNLISCDTPTTNFALLICMISIFNAIFLFFSLSLLAQRRIVPPSHVAIIDLSYALLNGSHFSKDVIRCLQVFSSINTILPDVLINPVLGGHISHDLLEPPNFFRLCFMLSLTVVINLLAPCPLLLAFFPVNGTMAPVLSKVSFSLLLSS